MKYYLPDIQQKQEGNLWQLQSLCLIQQVLPVPWTVDHWKRSPSNEISVRENSGHFPPDVYKIHHIAEKINLFNFCNFIVTKYVEICRVRKKRLLVSRANYNE